MQARGINMLEDINSIDRDSGPSEQLPLEEISSALSDDQIFELCDPQFLRETLKHDYSEVTSCSNFCQDNDDLPLATNNELYNSYSATTTTTTTDPTDVHGQEKIIKNDISASITFSTSQQQDQQPQLPLTNFVDGTGLSAHHYPNPDLAVAPLPGPAIFPPALSSSLPPMASFMPLNPSCSFLSHSTIFLGTSTCIPRNSCSEPSIDGPRISIGSFLLSTTNDVQRQDELDNYQGDNCGIQYPDLIPDIFKPESVQGFCSETQQLVNESASGSLSIGSEMSSLEDSIKVGKLSVEQRKEKIHRYMKKRNERNFSKKIKYACRKTLADSRPRVRGRFAKNDDFGESRSRLACSSHEEDDKDEVDVKEEDDMMDSSEIFAHISGVNSFKCNYSIQSWI